MSVLRFAHISDTHLGYRSLFKSDPLSGRNQRSVDIERAYETAVDDILTRDVQLVIHGGDVFHHTRPTWAAIRAFVRHTRRLSDAGLPVIVIGGNHDTPRLRTSGSVFSVLELALPEVRFVCEYEQQAISLPELGLSVLAIPHGKLASPEGPSAFPVPGVRNVLVTHGLVRSLQLRGQSREPGEEEIADVLLDREFDYIALGHYHVFAQPEPNVWYSGSTERMGFGDEDVTPGYALVELGASGEKPHVTHIPLESRPMKTLAPINAEAMNARDIADLVLKRVAEHAVPEANLRIEIRNALRPDRREAETLIRREVGDACWHLQVFSRGDVLASPGETQRAASESMDVRALFDEFVAERKYDVPAFADTFARRGHRALDDAIRALDATNGEDSLA